ncbi:hypothetical protein KWH36_20705 [Xanthomonas campestris pv. fici]|nr:hypothetical protein [Xanthomonas euvesicatoria]MBV6843678.1 hypothetical protein [Xanthomonas campestris pv. fici]
MALIGLLVSVRENGGEPGNGARTQTVSFNRGSHVTVNVAVNDGTTNAPTCLGNAGQTFEQNNLTRGSCSVFGGASPGISFPQSN